MMAYLSSWHMGDIRVALGQPQGSRMADRPGAHPIIIPTQIEIGETRPQPTSWAFQDANWDESTATTALTCLGECHMFCMSDVALTQTCQHHASW